MSFLPYKALTQQQTPYSKKQGGTIFEISVTYFYFKNVSGLKLQDIQFNMIHNRENQDISMYSEMFASEITNDNR